ncbi:MAG TPA: hypothetical protein VN802_20470 [Stellaceae bacterium]|nr:hypothetical protein [Stellaceae bacterium]
MQIVSNSAHIIQAFDHVWADCAAGTRPTPVQPLLSCSILVSADSPIALLRLRSPAPLLLADILRFQLKYVFLGDARKCVEIDPPADGWRGFATIAEPDRPIMLARGNAALVDLNPERLWVVRNCLVAATLRLQPAIIAVHAGSAAIEGQGVLFVGPSGSGKTTLALAMAARGHDCFGDNVAIVRPASGELLPFRRIGYVRTGPRAAALDALLQARGAVPDCAADHPDEEPRIPLRIRQFFPGCEDRAVKLRHVFFLRGTAESTAVAAIDLGFDGFDDLLRPMTFDGVVAPSWGATTGDWVMRHLRLVDAFRKVRCYHLVAGPPDEAADSIERIVLEDC